MRELMQREVPSSRVHVERFGLDRFEVTNEELAATLNTVASSLKVVDDEDDHYPRYVRWNQSTAPTEFLVDLHHGYGGIDYTRERTFRATPGREQMPAVQVTWFGARLYCASRGNRLPSEDEWEAAARGAGNRRYPWGDTPIRCGGAVIPRDGLVLMDRLCAAAVSPARVGNAVQDVSPEGIHDLAGIVVKKRAPSPITLMTLPFARCCGC